MSRVKSLKLVNNILKEATIRSDMAKRIMYSILPSTVDPSQVVMSGGVVDYKALDAAVEGAADIIAFGTLSVADELRYYREYNPVLTELRSDFRDKFKQNRVGKNKFNASSNINPEYEKLLSLAIPAFADTKNWDDKYGGFAWEKTAKCLLQIYRLYYNLQILQKEQLEKYNPDNLDKITNIKKQLVMQMNIFDGLSHNSGTILERIVYNEDDFLSRQEPEIPEESELSKIRRMMDSKELDNTKLVYKEIEESLKGSGDIHRYKDYNHKIRDKEYHEEDYVDRLNQLNKIRLRKKINTNIDILDMLFENLDSTYTSYANEVKMFIKHQSHPNIKKIKHHLTWATESMNGCIHDLRDTASGIISKFINDYGEEGYPVSDKNFLPAASNIVKKIDTLRMNELKEKISNLNLEHITFVEKDFKLTEIRDIIDSYKLLIDSLRLY